MADEKEGRGARGCSPDLSGGGLALERELLQLGRPVLDDLALHLSLPLAELLGGLLLAQLEGAGLGGGLGLVRLEGRVQAQHARLSPPHLARAGRGAEERERE